MQNTNQLDLKGIVFNAIRAWIQKANPFTIVFIIMLPICCLYVGWHSIFAKPTKEVVKTEVQKEQPKQQQPKKDVAVQSKPDKAKADIGMVIVPPTTGPSTDLSPASIKDLKGTDIKGYIEKCSSAAIEEMDKYGIPASITMAQAIIESRCGTSILAVKSNNHFGIKCFSKTCSNGHCERHTDDHHKDFFVKFKDGKESFRAHSLFLKRPLYAKLFKFGKDYAAWAKGLRECGYATDKTYDKKLIAVIKRYELDRLDNL
jgi:flagellum-specific peptidoglycan hydrolase FlgJ